MPLLKIGIEGRDFNRKRRKRASRINDGKKSKKEQSATETKKKDQAPSLVSLEPDLNKSEADTTALNPITEPEIVRDEEKKIQEGQVIIGTAAKKINFKMASANLLPSAQEALEEVAQYLDLNPDYKIIITGHTDDTGDASFNLRLSLERAEAVKNFLIHNGVSEGQISTAGAGMKKPLLPNTSSENRQLNRRVEFLLYKE